MTLLFGVFELLATVMPPYASAVVSTR